MTLENSLLVISGVLTSLLAGVFYTFNIAVVPALRTVKGTQHIAVMQAINEKIKNPVFFLTFFGPTILLPMTAYLHRSEGNFAFILVAALLHILGANGITVACNLPLNEQFAKIDFNSLSAPEADQIRQNFQGRTSLWTRYHNMRTVASIGATILIFLACLTKIGTK